MRLALLDCDDEIKLLLRQVATKAGHRIVAVCEADDADLPLEALLPTVERSVGWEALLARDDVDLVVVANPRQLGVAPDGLDPQVRRVDQLKKLAQAGLPLLVSHPAADLLDAYEIEMFRREGGGVIFPWFPSVTHPGWLELLRLVRCSVADQRADAGMLVAQFDWERTVIGRSKPAILDALVRDLVLIERLCGKLKRVTALAGAGLAAGAAEQQNWQSLTVQLEAANGMLVRWSASQNRPVTLARITFSSANSQWHVEIPASNDEAWSVRAQDPANQTIDGDGASECASVLKEIEAMRHDSPRVADTWLEACRSLETLAGVERSLQRGRTIELSQAEQTEEHAFKGVMATGGCLLLLGLLFGVFVVSLVEGLQLPLRNWTIWRLWPLFMFIPLAIFLGMQFLGMFIDKRDPKS